MKTISKILILSILIFGLFGCQQETTSPTSNNQNQNNQNQNNPNQTTGSEVFWNASDYEVGTYTTETVFGNITLIASSKTAIDENSKTIDEIAFTKRLKLGGTGSTSSAALKFTTTGKSDITVYCASSSSTGTGRMLVLATADNVINDTNEAPLTAGKLVYSDVPAGTYYLYSSNSGINIYGIKIAYETTGTPSEPDNPSTDLEKAIRVTDVPTGWASYTGTKDLAGGSVTPPTNYGGNGGSVVTVSTRSELQNYAKNGNYVIYIDGMIDMTDGMLPSKASESTSALDSWIASKSSVATSLSTWKTYYADGNTDSADESGAYKTNRQTLSNAWSSLITINVASNTTIIGLTDESGIKGGCFKISGKSNIVMRNLIIQDAYDPFPQIEKGDGFNANYDAIEISNGSKYVWIDHCTFRDTISKTDSDFDTVTLSDGAEKKYQVFDGLCDIKQASDFITVSYCKFMDHDKTQLIGHSADYTDDTNHQTITLHNNYYLNCGQRLPMVRFATIHIYNNYYDTDGTGRKNSYCIGLRENNKVYAENNYFGNVTPVSNSQGSYYFTGNYGYDNTGSAAWTPSSYYTYTPLSAAEAKDDVTENAGAGKLSVIK
ncbi:MAG: hypothetical protein IJA53_07480 [Spirochaetaceae bacterium]|nr:hypothetical protein [Spirochaetaceae bacterium]